MPSANPIPLPHLDRLRQLLSNRRNELQLTYDDLAALSGVGRRTIVAVESGKSPGSMETWFRLCHALGVGFDEIFTASTGLTTNVVHDPSQPAPIMQTRNELSLETTSDRAGALHADGKRPNLVSLADGTLAESGATASTTTDSTPAEGAPELR